VSKVIEAMLDAVDWQPTQQEPPESGGRYATHEGVLSIGEFPFRVYQLNTGERVLHADDVQAFFTSGAKEDADG